MQSASAGLTVKLTANAGSYLSVAAGRQGVTWDHCGYHCQFVAPGGYHIAINDLTGFLVVISDPLASTVPGEGIMTVPPIGLASAPARVYLRPASRSSRVPKVWHNKWV